MRGFAAGPATGNGHCVALSSPPPTFGTFNRLCRVVQPPYQALLRKLRPGSQWDFYPNGSLFVIRFQLIKFADKTRHI